MGTSGIHHHLHSSPASSSTLLPQNLQTQPVASQQDHANAASPFLTRIRHVILGDPTADRLRAVVEQIVMQLAVSRPEFQSLKEQGIVVEGQRVEDVKVCLLRTSPVSGRWGEKRRQGKI
jgi:hypothetical protein